jgi:hypothetical protein
MKYIARIWVNSMGGIIHKEENTIYQIDFTAAIWSTDEIHNLFHRACVAILSDVDFVAETDNNILFIEYKNAKAPGVSKPDAFNPSDERLINKIAIKFYDTYIYINACGHKKGIKYIYILDYPKGDSTTRKLIRNKISKKLPFELQKNEHIRRKIIEEFEVLSIDEWNSHSEYGKYPMSVEQHFDIGINRRLKFYQAA